MSLIWTLPSIALIPATLSTSVAAIASLWLKTLSQIPYNMNLKSKSKDSMPWCSAKSKTSLELLLTG